MLTAREVVRHNTSASCWVVINRQAYDLTEFLDHHPGGANSILRYAGRVRALSFNRRQRESNGLQISKDATDEYEPIHPPGTIEKYLPKGLTLFPPSHVAVLMPIEQTNIWDPSNPK
jgi:L-lactate dehydrogenase (cytochrome)